MKTLARTLVLVLLLAVTCSATFVAVMAAEDFTAEEEMAEYGTTLRGVTPRNTYPETRMDGYRVSDLENAPALSSNHEVIIPQLVEPETEEMQEQGTPLASPDTGYESYGLQYLAALVLLGGAGGLARKKRAETE